MENLKEKYLSGENEYQLSLSKILGKPIKDITGYVSNEFSIPVFQITKVWFEDGTSMHVQGEHDIAYLPSFGDDEYDELIEKLGDDE